MMSLRHAFVLCSLLAGNACASMRHPPAPTNTPPSDAQIAAIILSANDADIQYAQLAKATSRNPAVLEYAAMTFEDHSGLNSSARALAAKLGLAPVDGETSLDIRDDAETKREQLRQLSGTAFDSAYASIEFAYHQRIWDVIEQSLLPAVRSAELRALIVQAQPAISMHKTHAMSLRAKFQQP
jgi:putative membrane protein